MLWSEQKGFLVYLGTLIADEEDKTGQKRQAMILFPIIYVFQSLSFDSGQNGLGASPRRLNSQKRFGLIFAGLLFLGNIICPTRQSQLILDLYMSHHDNKIRAYNIDLCPPAFTSKRGLFS